MAISYDSYMANNNLIFMEDMSKFIFNHQIVILIYFPCMVSFEVSSSLINKSFMQ